MAISSLVTVSVTTTDHVGVSPAPRPCWWASTRNRLLLTMALLRTGAEVYSIADRADGGLTRVADGGSHGNTEHRCLQAGVPQSASRGRGLVTSRRSCATLRRVRQKPLRQADPHLGPRTLTHHSRMVAAVQVRPLLRPLIELRWLWLPQQRFG